MMYFYILHQLKKGADLRSAKHGDQKLSMSRPVVFFGGIGSFARNSFALLFAASERMEPLIQCRCFRGSLSEFEAKVKERHSGTRFEAEYLAAIEFIKAIDANNKKVETENAAEEGGAA